MEIAHSLAPSACVHVHVCMCATLSACMRVRVSVCHRTVRAHASIISYLR